MLARCVQKAWGAEQCATHPHLRMNPVAFEHKMSGSFYGNLKRKKKQKEKMAEKRGIKRLIKQIPEDEDEDLGEDRPAKQQKQAKPTVTRKKRPADSEGEGEDADEEEKTTPGCTPGGDGELSSDSEDTQPQLQALEEGALCVRILLLCVFGWHMSHSLFV
jgi:hypothetical protein